MLERLLSMVAVFDTEIVSSYSSQSQPAPPGIVI